MLPTDPKTRKEIPLYSGLVRYFPDALAAVAQVSFIGNKQHNPGQPLHWAKEKSTDELDAQLRHLFDNASCENGDGPDRDTDGAHHLAKNAWRALAKLQRAFDAGEDIFWGPGEDSASIRTGST